MFFVGTSHRPIAAALPVDDKRAAASPSADSAAAMLGPTSWRLGLCRRDRLRPVRSSLALLLLLLLPLVLLVALTSYRLVHHHLPWPAGHGAVSADSILQPRLSCAGVRLLLLVPTAPHQSERRGAIRDTWAKALPGSPLRLVFVVGRAPSGADWGAVAAEWRLHGDVLYRPDVEDSYGRLTQKMLGAFEWALASDCRRVPFLAKVDSDVFLRADNLLRLLQSLPSPGAEFILGHVNHRAVPKRNPASRWFAPRQLFPAAHFPDYVFGAFYLMPSATARRLLAGLGPAERRLAARLRLEDVFITGILARRRGVDRRHAPAVLQGVSGAGEVCSQPRLVSVHRVPPAQMRLMWRMLHEC